jgi:non-heme chloroperoxidase
MSWRESGDPSGLPVLCLHGYGDSLRSFERMTPHLPARLRVLAVSHRGHGDSPRPERDEDYTVGHFAEDAIAFLDAMKIDRAVIVGHSMGSFVAQRIAIDAPDRLIGLVLIGSFVTLNGHAGIEEMWQDVVRHMEDPVDPDFIREFQTGTIAMPVDPDYVEVIVAESLKLPARIWRGAMAGMMGQDHTQALGAMTLPTLIVWGDKDALFGHEEEAALCAAIPHARFVTYEGVGHGVQWEVPERVAGDVGAFALGLAGR